MPLFRKGDKQIPPNSQNKSAAPLCGACMRPAYAAEAYIAADRTSFHRKCLKCAECKRNVAPGQQKTHAKELYCMRCYEDIFNPKDDERMQKNAMQVLPNGGAFPLKPVAVVEGLSEEELRRQEEARLAAAAWEEAHGSKDPAFGECVKIKETVAIITDMMDSHSLC